MTRDQCGYVHTVYSTCRSCTAKWFAPRPLGTCPRCGDDHVMHTKAMPPWPNRLNEGSGAPPIEQDEVPSTRHWINRTEKCKDQRAQS